MLFQCCILNSFSSIPFLLFLLIFWFPAMHDVMFHIFSTSACCTERHQHVSSLCVALHLVYIFRVVNSVILLSLLPSCSHPYELLILVVVPQRLNALEALPCNICIVLLLIFPICIIDLRFNFTKPNNTFSFLVLCLELVLAIYSSRSCSIRCDSG